MDEFGKFDEDGGRIGAAIVKLLQSAERLRHFAAHDGLEQIDDAAMIGEAQHGAQGLRRDSSLPFSRPMAGAMRDRLVEQRQRIARRTLGRARDQRQRLGLDGDALLGADSSQKGDQRAGVDPAQVKALAARAHRHRHLLDFRRRKEEFHMVRRLFERLQETVEGRLREHMHFVDDIDLGARHDRSVARALDDFAHVLDAGVRGGVHLDDVDMARFDDRLTMQAEFAHVDGRTRHGGAAIVRGQFIIEGARQNARGRRLSDAADARQNIGLMNAIEVEGVGKGSDHGLLADQIVETGWTIFAGEDAIGSGGLRAGILRRTRRRRRGHLFAGAAGLAGSCGFASTFGALMAVDAPRQDPFTRQTRPKARSNREVSARSRALRGRNAKSRRLDRDPPGLVRAASFRI